LRDFLHATHSNMSHPDSHDLRLHHSALDVDPKPSLIHWTHDAFDNSICFLEWPERLRTDRLNIVSTLELTHHPDGPPQPVYSLDRPPNTSLSPTRRKRPPTLRVSRGRRRLTLTER